MVLEDEGEESCHPLFASRSVCLAALPHGSVKTYEKVIRSENARGKQERRLKKKTIFESIPLVLAHRAGLVPPWTTPVSEHFIFSSNDDWADSWGRISRRVRANSNESDLKPTLR